MSARRQASTTSLSKYARASSPELQANRSLDFCNAFWGVADGGFDVLLARMRGAGRTMDELRAFWKERVAIEDDYAKRLAKLAKQTLGRDEIGDLRNAFDTLRLETDKQAAAHLHLAQQIRSDLETPTAAFSGKQAQHKKIYQAAIEKAYKVKQAQESYVTRAREKYETDCLRINSFTAQSTLVQGKDLEKIQLKLERAQQTVQANERDFANFARALQDTVQKWEKDWKGFSDGCQDLEEERIEFMKDNMWAYANAVSTVCVTDDECCEKIRLALEQLEPEKDMENFVRDYGTGNQIPDPPAFVNYTTPDAATSLRPTSRTAQFVRVSHRGTPTRQPPPPPPEEESVGNSAGIGAGGGRGGNVNGDPLARSQTQSRSGSQGPANGTVYSPMPVAPHQAIFSPSSSSQATSSPNKVSTPSSFRPAPDGQGDPIDPANKTMFRVGPNAYEVDPTRDPQGSSSRSGPGPGPGPSGVKVGDDSDPLARQMADLIRRGTADSRRPSAAGASPPAGSGPGSAGPSTSRAALSPPPGSTTGVQQKKDYRASAEYVVGAHPSTISASRPSSPAPPTASFMQPPPQTSSSPIPVEDVVASYQQSFPGESKPISRSNSRRTSVNMSIGTQSQESLQERPVSREGHAGIGAHGRRSPSPQPSRSVSPALQPPGNSGYNPASVGRSGSAVQRAASPNHFGIALDSSGRVAHDSMAENYARQQQQQRQQMEQRRQSYNMGAPGPGMGNPSPMQQAPQNSYNSPQQASSVYPMQNHPYAQPQHVQALPPQRPYTNPPPQQYAAPTPAPVQPPVQQQPQQQQQYGQPPAGYPNGGSLARGPSTAGYYGQSAQVPQPQYQPAGQVYRSPSPALEQAPPTGQYTPDGLGVLFYVKALYDYAATIPEEFDFQAGDIIAVTATPEDGWWSGMLLDDQRRVPGRTVFPSNFVHLF